MNKELTSLISFLMMITAYKVTAADTIWIDLSEDATTRYNHLFPTYTVALHKLAQDWMKVMRYSLDDLNFFDVLAQDHHDQQLVEETRAVSLASGVPFNQLFSMQFMYDFGSTHRQSLVFGCTSIVVTPAIGKPYIARNLDYGIKESLRALMAIVNYYQGDKSNIIMSAMGTVGQLSLTHSISNKHCSMTINQLNSEFTRSDLFDIIKSNQYDSLIRQIYLIARDSQSYEEAHQRILDTTINSHGYVIIVGQERSQNAIIHMLDWFDKDSVKIPSREVNIPEDGNFIAATNGYDTHDSINRCETAEKRMQSLSEDLLSDPMQVVKNVLALSPNKNQETIASAVLRPLQGKDGIEVVFYA